MRSSSGEEARAKRFGAEAGDLVERGRATGEGGDEGRGASRHLIAVAEGPSGVAGDEGESVEQARLEGAPGQARAEVI